LPNQAPAENSSATAIRMSNMRTPAFAVLVLASAGKNAGAVVSDAVSSSSILVSTTPEPSEPELVIDKSRAGSGVISGRGERCKTVAISAATNFVDALPSVAGLGD